MKKVFLFALVATIASCNQTKNINAYVVKHCQEVHSVDMATGQANIAFKCDSLYNFTEVAKVCSKSEICFDVSKGRIQGEVKCGDENTSLVDIFKNLVKQIKFK